MDRLPSSTGTRCSKSGGGSRGAPRGTPTDRAHPLVDRNALPAQRLEYVTDTAHVIRVPVSQKDGFQTLASRFSHRFLTPGDAQKQNNGAHTI